MEKHTDLQEILEHLRTTEGESFTFQEEKLIFESEKRQADKAGIAIKILSVFGGLLATLIFLSFLAIAGMYDQYQTILILGMLFIGIAVFLNKVFNLLIIDTSVIAVYLIGFCLLGYGLAEYAWNGNEISLLFIAISFASLLIAQNFILAFVSILIINGCFIALILNHEQMNMIHIYNTVNVLLLALLMLNESRVLRAGRIISRLYRPARIALILSVLVGLFFVGKRWWIDLHWNISSVWLSSVVTFVALVFLISMLLKTFGRNSAKDHVMAYSVSIPILLSLALLPAISGAMLIILMSFFINYKTGVVIGIMAFIYFISQFYYDLNFTLLTKSMLLICSGILFVLGFVVTQIKWKSDEKV